MKHFHATLIAAAGLSAAAVPAAAATINVLWTSGTSAYNTSIAGVAAAAPGFDPDGDGSNDWNLTFWDESVGAAPSFSAYDVLVIGSTYGIDQDYSGSGFFGLGVSARGLIDESAAISAARGERTFLSGQDADWHNLNNIPGRDDGPLGFMVNAVNWAAAGAGLGIVSMTDRYDAGSTRDGWWTADGSFLKDELGAGVVARNTETVAIGAGQEGFPINEGLTTAGLSNWSTSAHAAFLDEIEGYARINFDGVGGGITIVTAGEEDGGTIGGGGPTVPPIPLPAGAWLMFGALGTLAGLRRRAKRA